MRSLETFTTAEVEVKNYKLWHSFPNKIAYKGDS